ncbi:MAG TPA: hypothetical protein VFQ07_11130 [Candidatus Polarisedimenticolia bacterium]|nr:hypothetical protein [Candidatus Polarisedimenticolia bacterium]
MIDKRDAKAAAVQAAARHETLFLAGRPTLKQFIRFARTNAVRPAGSSRLADTWRAAYEMVQRLQVEEAGRADDPPIVRIPVGEHETLLAEFLKDPLVQNGFNLVPTEVAFVELDRLVVSQKHIDLTHARRVEERLGRAPGPEQVFRACLADDHRQPHVEWAPAGDNRYVFVSRSNDLRTLGLQALEPRHLRGIAPAGEVVGVIGMAVGFGSNFLSVIHAENRLLLHNGSHRAYALRRLGIKSVPCIVQHVSCRDELELIALPEVRRNPDLYLKDPRPPMLCDYFHPGLHTVLRVRPRLRQITVRIDVEETYVPELPDGDRD